MKRTQYKRQFRELTDETKSKISNSLKGRHLSDIHKAHLSESMTSYWSCVRSKYDVEQD